MKAERMVVWCLLAMGCTGCEKAMQNMYDQPKYKDYRVAAQFDDGKVEQDSVADTEIYSRGVLSGTSSGRIGADMVTQWQRDRDATANPYPVTLALLQQGRERYDIYCAPCHSPTGDGDGLIVRHGYPHTPTLHSEASRHISDRQLIDIISNGYGMMYGYAGRISPADRWAIVAYIRALQLSQHTPRNLLSDEDQKQLKEHAG